MPKVKISREIKATLDTALKRTRMQPLGLDAVIKKQLGREYAHNHIDAIYKGKAKFISVDTWNTIQNIISALPDAPQTTGGYGAHAKPHKRRAGYISLTKEMSGELNAQLERVGLSYNSIINRCPDEYKKFYKASNITNWRKGAIKSIDQDAWNALITTLRGLPDKPENLPIVKNNIPISKRATPKKQAIRKGEGLLPIHDDDIEAIRFHRQRTGVSYSKLFDGWALLPSGLNARLISSWTSNQTKNANPAYIRLVLSAYEVLPDK